jgi:tetratricopeptide (TPR) repeat protein
MTPATYRRTLTESRRGNDLYGRLLLILAAFALVGADPQVIPDDLIRQGNGAVERGDFDAALLFYQQAEERGTDPGLIAFNKATAYYHLQDYRKADAHYRMALDDSAISSERRAKALFNLGDCLVQEASDSDARRLRDAIRFYELCLEMNPEEGLRRNASHNLELAKLLWNNARAKSANPPEPNTDDPPDDPKPPEPKKKEKEHSQDGNDPKKNGNEPKKQDADPKSKIDKNGKADPNSMLKKKSAPPRDQGPPVLPPSGPQPPRSPEDTLELLRRAAERLQKEREGLRKDATILEKPSGRDW